MTATAKAEKSIISLPPKKKGVFRRYPSFSNGDDIIMISYIFLQSDGAIESKNELKGVAEEDALRRLLNSDEEDDDEEKEEEIKDKDDEDADRDDEAGPSKEDETKKKKNKDKKNKKNKDKKPRKEEYGMALFYYY